MRKILFACVANSMRSQMAEGFAKHYADQARVEIRSGGTLPSGVVHPKVVRAMAQRGIDISSHTSKGLDFDFATKADAFVSLCGPLDEACPRHLHERVMDWNMPDPGVGSEDELDRLGDEIERRVIRLLKDLDVLRPNVRLPA